MSIMVQNIETFINMFKNESDIEPWEDVEIVPEDEEEAKSQENKTPKGESILSILSILSIINSSTLVASLMHLMLLMVGCSFDQRQKEFEPPSSSFRRTRQEEKEERF